MPFLPLLLLLVVQTLSRSASFALGWATALFFGQIPGNKGRMVSVISLISVGWVILVAGFAVPLLVGAVADALHLVARNFDVQPAHAVGLALAIGLVPPVVAGVVELAGFEGQRSPIRWLRRVPVSYPAVALLGLSVLQMLLIAPVILLVRLRERRIMLQVPLLLRPGGSQEQLSEAVATAVRGLDAGKVERGPVEGPLAWPLRTVGYAARHLLGAVVRGDPVHLRADGLELFAYGTDVAILGKKEAAYPARAAIERELALGDAYLTWSQDSQALEDELIRIHEAGDDRASLTRKLDQFRERIDSAPITGDEWNVLDRLRLQLAQEAVRAARR